MLEVLDDRLDDPVDLLQPVEMILDIARADQLGIVAMHEGRRLGLRQPLDGTFGDASRSRRILRHDVQQIDRHPGIGDLGRDAAAHHAGADDGGAGGSPSDRLQNGGDALAAADALGGKREFLALALQELRLPCR